jgi:hypothetical protein
MYEETIEDNVMGRIINTNERTMIHHDIFYGRMKNKELFIIGRRRNR